MLKDKQIMEKFNTDNHFNIQSTNILKLSWSITAYVSIKLELIAYMRWSAQWPKLISWSIGGGCIHQCQLTFQNESSISSVCSCTDASTTKLLGIWPTTAHQFRTLFSARACVLRSASSHQVSVPRYRLSTYGCQAFSVAGPMVWNSLPEDMPDPECSVDSYRQSLKTFLFSQY